MVLLLAGGACLALLAALAGERLAGRRPPSVHRPVRAMSDGSIPATADDPTDLATRPFAGIGVELLSGEPDGVFAPPGSVRLYTARRKTPGGLTDIATYLVAADIAEVEGFYRTRLERAGYELKQRTGGMRAGDVSLMFMRDVEHYYRVSLRPADKDNTRLGAETPGKVKIVLVVAGPGR